MRMRLGCNACGSARRLPPNTDGHAANAWFDAHTAAQHEGWPQPDGYPPAAHPKSRRPR